MKFKKLETDTEFVLLLPLIAKFSLDTGSLMWKNVKEVTSNFSTTENVTWIFLDEFGGVEGYVHGIYISNKEFHISQCYHYKKEGNIEAFEKICKQIKKDGVIKVIILTTLNPKIFEKYGLRLERFLLSKEI